MSVVEFYRGKRVLGVLAGEDMPLLQLRSWAESAEIILAADGAVNRLHSIGIQPSAAIGDFDSIDARHVTDETWIRHEPDQDSTDCDKLLALAQRNGATEITLGSVEGDRPDHVLSTLLSACRTTIGVKIAYRTGMGWIVRPNGDLIVAAAPGCPVSLIPLETCEGVEMNGVRWPLSQARLQAQGLVSQSNEATTESVSVSIRSGFALLYLRSGPMPSW